MKSICPQVKYRWFFTLAAVIGFTAAARAETFTHITAENGAVSYDIAKDAVTGWYTEPSSDYRFKLTFKQGQRMTEKPVVVGTIQSVTSEHYLGNSALQIQIDARDEIDTTKAAYKASIDSENSRDKFSPLVTQPADYFHGFAMKIDAGFYQLPATGELIFEQWWQGSPYHPPVSLVIVTPADCAVHGWTDAGHDGNFALMLRDDEHNALNSTPGEVQYYDLGPVTTGQWLWWVVHVRPSAITADGAVTITLNDQQKLKLDHIKVGYNPENPRYTDRKPSQHIVGVNVCLYRMNGQNFQRFFFDEIKFADRFEDAVTIKQGE
jgi:hypothetical protein